MNAKKIRHGVGTTLIELLIAIGVTFMISSVAILYSSSSRKQINLYIETVKLSQMILKAKSSAILIYYDPLEPTCGYGVRMYEGAREYALFKYVAEPDEDCNAITTVGESSYEEVQRFSLTQGVIFKDVPDDITEILFTPPDPKTYLWSDGMRVYGGGNIHLTTNDDSGEKVISVNTGGQISY